MIGNMRIDYTCKMEQHSIIVVGFDVCSYTGSWFNTPLYLDGIAPMCSYCTSVNRRYMCYKLVRNIIMITYRFYTPSLV